MAMVDVDGSSHLLVDSQPKSVGLVWGLAATRRSVCIHQMNWVNSRSDHGHEDSTINIVVDYYYYYYYYDKARTVDTKATKIIMENFPQGQSEAAETTSVAHT